MTAPVAPTPTPAAAPAPEQQTVIPAGPPVSGGPAGGREADDMAMMMDAQFSVVQEPQGASEAGASEAPAAPAAGPNQTAQAPPATTVPGG